MTTGTCEVIGFNHGTYEVGYSGGEKPSKEMLIDCATRAVSSNMLYFDISQRDLDCEWKYRSRPWGNYCDFSLVILRCDGRSYLHG